MGAIYFCVDCDREQHRGFAVHNRAALSLETHGWAPVRSDTREFQLRVCTICNQNFNQDEVFNLLVEQRFEVLYVTPNNGHAESVVIPVKCLRCGSIVGDRAGDYSCIEGKKKIWFDMQVTHIDRSYFVASKFSLTREASSRALESRCKASGSFGHERIIADAFSVAHR